MTGATQNPAGEAFLRILRDAHTSDDARGDALAAVIERRLWVVTWEPRAQGLRTLVNTSGEEALAIFSTEDQMEEAAARFGWRGPDGSVAKSELEGKELLKYAVKKGLSFLVVDIAAEHALEFTRAQFEAASSPTWAPGPLPQTEEEGGGIREIRHTPSVSAAGTYGAASVIPPKRTSSRSPVKISTAPVVPPRPRLPDPPAPAKLPDPPMADYVEPTAPTEPPSAAPLPDPPAMKRPQTLAPPSVAPARSIPPPTSIPPMPRSRPSPGISLAPMGGEPDAQMLSDLANVLRNFPEVEWAAYCEIQRAVGPPSPAVGLRLDPSYRENVTMMIRQLCEAGRKYAIELDAVLIDDPEMMRQARSTAVVFFPWRPKSLVPPGI